MKPASLTIKSDTGLVNVLISEIEVYRAGEKDCIRINAIWDTGATGSAITKATAEKLNLLPTGIVQVSTTNGLQKTQTYTIDIILPEVVKIKSIVATEVAGFVGECEALIGMDIITLGDFSITNLNGKTCMSFRIPSSHEIDYVKSPDYGIVEIVDPEN